MGRYYDEYGNTRYDDEIAYAGDMFSRDAIAACCCSMDSDSSWSAQGTSSITYSDTVQKATAASLTAIDSKVSAYDSLCSIADASSTISATVDEFSNALAAISERLSNLEAKFGNGFKSSFLKRKYYWEPLKRSSLKTLGAMG